MFQIPDVEKIQVEFFFKPSKGIFTVGIIVIFNNVVEKLNININI